MECEFQLENAARMHVEFMITNNCFDHESDGESVPGERITNENTTGQFEKILLLVNWSVHM